MRQSATWRRGEPPICAKRETTLQTPSQKKGQKHTSPLFALPRQSLLVLPWPSKLHAGRQRRTCCSDSGSGTTPGLLHHEYEYAPASETQAQAAKGDCSTDVGPGVRLAFPCRPHTFLARQSPRPSHIQRAQLAIGTSFRCWRPSFGQRHHLLRQVWSGLLGACGCSLPPMQRISREQSVAAAQIEVWPVSQQTLPWLDSRTRNWNLARLVWVEQSWGPPHPKSNGWPLRQRC